MVHCLLFFFQVFVNGDNIVLPAVILLGGAESLDKKSTCTTEKEWLVTKSQNDLISAFTILYKYHSKENIGHIHENNKGNNDALTPPQQ